MILSTVTILGPGYDHWTFQRPTPLEKDDLFRLNFIERAQHVMGNVAFVDAYVAHVPFYPTKLSITIALWSNSIPSTWRDHVKRLPLIKDHAVALRNVGKRMGLTKTLDLKMEAFLDYYPTPQGFRGIKERKEFGNGPNENFVGNLFYVLQQSGCDSLAGKIRLMLASDKGVVNRSLVENLLRDLETGRTILPRYSQGHTDVPSANFRSRDVQRALDAQQSLAKGSAADGR